MQNLGYEIIFQTIIFLILSLVIGSFLANLAQRMSLGECVLSGRSRCLFCATKLGVVELIPVFSWIGLRGRCRHCGTGISPFYVIMEILAVLLFIWSLLVLSPDYLWAGCLLGWSLLALSAIDLKIYRLPDFLTLPLIVLGVFFNSMITPELTTHFVIGAIVGYILFMAVAVFYRRLRGREGLGLGDAKLLSAAGAWVGWQGLASVIMIAALIGIIVAILWGRVMKKNLAITKIPFGPFLSFALWLTWLYGPMVLTR